MENQLQINNQEQTQPDTMTLGDFMSSGPSVATTQAPQQDTLTLDEFMGAPVKMSAPVVPPIPEEARPNFVKWMSNAIMGGLYGATTGVNRTLGYALQFAPPVQLLSQFPAGQKILKGAEETFITSGEKEQARLREEVASPNKVSQFAYDTMSGLINLGVTLPFDVMTGEASKFALAGNIAPKVEQILSRIPDFALGSGFRGWVEGVQKEGNLLQKAYSGTLTAAENVAIGTLYGKIGGPAEEELIGKSAEEIAKITKAATAKGFATMPAIGAASAYYDAAKEGRVATPEEVAKGFAEGLMYQGIFTLIPHLKEATKIGAEKLTLGHYERELTKHVQDGNIIGVQKTINDFMDDPKIRIEFKETFATILGEKLENIIKAGPEAKVETAMTAKEALNYLGIDNKGQPLEQGKITVVSSSGKLGQKAKQTGLEGVRKETLDVVKNLSDKYNIPITITGLTEAGHAEGQYSHGTGYKVDLRLEPQLDNIITSWEKVAPRLNKEGKYEQGFKDPDSNAIFWKEGNHWDVEVSIPVEPIRAVEPSGEFKERGLSRSIEERAVEDKLTLGFRELPQYETVNKIEQARLAIDLMNTDPARAVRIAMGEEEPPQGLLPESVLTAVINRTTRVPDAELIHKLGTQSGLLSEATVMGQRISMLSMLNPDSAVTAVKEIAKARKETAQRRLGVKNIDKVQKEDVRKIKEEVKKATAKKETWADFVKSIQC